MNDKIKAAFIAQYYGLEKAAYADGYERAFTVSTLTINSEIEYLLLRSVNHLTDDECLEIGRFYGW